jgi:hypothetical protein
VQVGGGHFWLAVPNRLLPGLGSWEVYTFCLAPILYYPCVTSACLLGAITMPVLPWRYSCTCYAGYTTLLAACCSYVACTNRFSCYTLLQTVWLGVVYAVVQFCMPSPSMPTAGGFCSVAGRKDLWLFCLPCTVPSVSLLCLCLPVLYHLEPTTSLPPLGCLFIQFTSLHAPPTPCLPTVPAMPYAPMACPPATVREECRVVWRWAASCHSCLYV